MNNNKYLNICGVIAEYNPLHNGHVYHFNNINADIKILVMSSSFTMRGDLSIFDKFTKTRQALDLGFDIVVELPFALAVERADIFASNSVKLLNMLQANNIIVGSEENNIELYKKYYDEFNINNINRNELSFKVASLNELPFKSNDLLGFFYYKAIRDNNYNIDLKTIKRIGNDYLDKDTNNDLYASATAIRNNLDLIDKYCPSFVSNDKDKILDENKIFKYIKYQILNMDINDLKNIFMVDEGIENRLKDVYKFNNYEDFLDYLISKRYTKSRIKRMLSYVLFNIKKDEINKIYENEIDFVRILGYSNKGKEYINSIKKDLNIYTNIKNDINDILDIEIKISKTLDNIYDINLFKNEQSKPIEKRL